MPEGPSIAIIREAATSFAGRKVLRVSGNSKVDIQRLHNRTLIAVRSWGKHFLLEFKAYRGSGFDWGWLGLIASRSH